MASAADGLSGRPVAAPLQGAAGRVATALTSAAEATGVDFGYLYNVAARESGLNPNAKASSSSATGLFQFVEQTWLAAVKAYGADHGMKAEADAIVRTPGGGYAVSDQDRRAAILNLRRDPESASTLAAELALHNKEILEKKLGRPAAPADLYAAHFLGAGGASKLLAADKDASAAALAPAAARANRPVFYDGARAKSVGEVIAGFEATIGAAAPKAASAKAVSEEAVSEKAAGTAASSIAAAPVLADFALASPIDARDIRTAPPTGHAETTRPNEPPRPRSPAADLGAATRAIAAADARYAPLAVMALGAVDPMVLSRSVLVDRR